MGPARYAVFLLQVRLKSQSTSMVFEFHELFRSSDAQTKEDSSG